MQSTDDALDVFISYSHLNLNEAATLETYLRKSGLSVWRDDRLLVGRAFPIDIERALRSARRVLVIWSEHSVKSKWVVAEATLAAYMCKLVPIIIDRCQIPRGLHKLNAMSFVGRSVHSEAVIQALGEPSDRLQCRFEDPPEIDLSHMTETPELFLGRSEELKLLDDALTTGHILPDTDVFVAPDTNTLIFVASGGTGKTALVNYWLRRYTDVMPSWGIKRIFAWSFYRQGSADDRLISSDLFFDVALRWFGYDGPFLSSPFERATKLADLICERRCILILDGLETLQFPPGSMGGRLRDETLRYFLKKLTLRNIGLCIITTRHEPHELSSSEDRAVIIRKLRGLSVNEGVLLLRRLQIRGAEGELRLAVVEYDGHALALRLLGNYLRVVFAGDIVRSLPPRQPP